MKPGDLVGWKLQYTLEIHPDIGLVLSSIPREERGGDGFPHWHVLFPRGVLHCRESDLRVVHENG